MRGGASWPSKVVRGMTHVGMEPDRSWPYWVLLADSDVGAEWLTSLAHRWGRVQRRQ